MSDFDDLEAIADQNSNYGNIGTRDKLGRGAKTGRGNAIGSAKKPKWRNQLRALKIKRKVAVNKS